MQQDKWDRRFLLLAQHIAGWSKDPSTKVGAVLVQDGNRIVGLGFNGFARGVYDTEERYAEREMKYKLVVHAEINSIIMAGPLAKGATLYVWPAFAIPPICVDCAKVAIQAGVREVVGYEADPNEPRAQRWAESIALSKQMFDEASVGYRGIKA